MESHWFDQRANRSVQPCVNPSQHYHFTVIRYQLPVQNKVRLTIYNVLGQEVRMLVDEIQEAGFKSVEWDASRVVGITSGVYFYCLQAHPTSGGRAGSFSETKKLLLVK